MTSPYSSHSSSAANLSKANSLTSSAPPAALSQRNVPAGTLLPGTLVTVGKHNVTIERWLSEGGFAHVYVVRLKEKMKLADGSVGDVACLKRVMAPDKEALGSVRTEVETMKRLKGHRHVVTYIDSHACALTTGGYEVFLLMEFCSAGGLIDFMNTRLQDRLTESEILKIFGDVAQGVACMHYLQPPLLHRDIKVENVLIASSRCYKLCDFGSAAQPRAPGQSAAECRSIEEDIQKHTTLQYRSPEMVDVYRRLAIDEKSDIWALGVFLYKLCYYTTPFEDKGNLAILNASFTFPAFPSYSMKIKNLIAWTLRENPRDRPNIYEVVKAVSILRGSEIPIRDIYSSPTATQPIVPTSSFPSVSPLASPPTAPVTIPTPYQGPPSKSTFLPVEPMRRGRPSKTTSTPQPTLPAPSSDPFIKLPTTSATPFEFSAPAPTNPDDDDIASRFPPIEELSGGAFSSSSVSDHSKSQPPRKAAPTAAVEALADDAFALPVQPYRKKEVDALADDAFKPGDRRSRAAAQIRAALEREKNHTEWVEPIQDRRESPSSEEAGEQEERVLKPSEVIARGGVYAQPLSHTHPTHSISTPPVITSPPEGRSSETRRKAEESRRIINESRMMLEQQWLDTHEPMPERPQMVSVGVNTSPPPSPPRKARDLHVPPALQPLPSPLLNAMDSKSAGLPPQHLSMRETQVRPFRGKTPIPSPAKPIPIAGTEYIARAESPRPTSRGGYSGDLGSSPFGKGFPKQRPQSLYVDNDLEFLRSYDGRRTTPLERSFTGLSTASQPASLPSTSSDMQAVTPHPISSDQDLDFLRLKDEETKTSHHRQPSDHHRREISRSSQQNGRRSSSSGPANAPTSTKHSRQTSFGAISKGIMSGKFGDAFRKFEFSSGSTTHESPTKPISESRFRAEKTLAKMSPEQVAVEDEDGEDWIVETHDLPVKMKQHLSETRKSSAERDSKAMLRPTATSMPTAQVPQRAATTTAATSKAKLIEQRMKEYLSAQHREKPPPMTADGYGPYVADARAVRNVEEDENGQVRKAPPSIFPKPNILRRPSLKGSID